MADRGEWMLCRMERIMLIPFIMNLLLWGSLGISLITMIFWLYEHYLGWSQYEEDDIEHPPDSVQVRILTIGTDPALIQQTVNSLPDSVTDIHVITEQDMDVTGAIAHVVPTSFSCKAEKKGRALEWARRQVPCNKEFILYLDEDSQASKFEGLPEADVIQFGEKPYRTDSLIAYWVEVFRMGFQVEMRGFYLFNVPMYAWGGGIAVRTSLEDEVTWNFESIVEDTSFVWRAAKDHDVDFKYCETKFRNQAPPSLSALIQQRRRWFAGSISEIRLLPRRFFLISIIRNVSWVISVLIPIMMLAILFPFPLFMPFGVFELFSTSLAVFILSWAITGTHYMDERYLFTAAILILAPVLSVINALGAAYGAIQPPDGFTVTEKASDSSITKVTEGD